MAIYKVTGEAIICISPRGDANGHWYTEEFMFSIDDEGVSDVDALIEQKTIEIATKANQKNDLISYIGCYSHWDEDEEDWDDETEGDDE